MFDGIGFGYVADGMLKGQDRNRSWGLRQKQEERANASEERASSLFPVQLENAKQAGLGIRQQNELRAEDLTDEAKQRRQEKAGYGLDFARTQANNAALTGIGIGQQNQINAEKLTPEAQELRKQSQAADLKAKELQNQYNEYRNTDLGRKLSSENLAWDKKISDIVNQTDQEKAKLQLAQVLDMKYYRMLQLLDSGDNVGAALMFNESKSNPHKNIVRFEKTKDGGVVGYDSQGNQAMAFDANEIKGLRSRVSQQLRGGKSSQPKVMTEPTFDDMGQKNGEKAYIVRNDPQTGQPYKQYIEEKPQPTVSQQEEIALARTLVKSGEMSPEIFKQMYGEDYAPEKPQAHPQETFIVPRPR